MADTYIDYYEVSEYGRYFVREVARLESTAATLVDVGQLKTRVLAAVEAVEERLKTSSTQSSTLRTGRGGTEGATETMRDALKRFFHYLQSLPAGTPMDLLAFFPDGNPGRLSRFKPADILARADTALHGFDSPANADLPQATTWEATLADARTSLAQALDDKGAARSSDHASTGDLATARQDFLHIYNKVAKRLIRGVLADLGREHEYRRFFLDLQLNEGNHSQPPAGNTAPGTGNTAPGTGNTAPGTGTGNTAPGTGNTVPGTGNTAPGTGAGNTAPGTGNTVPGTGNTVPGTAPASTTPGNTAPGTGNTAPGTGNTVPGTGNTAPGTGTAGNTVPGTMPATTTPGTAINPSA